MSRICYSREKHIDLTHGEDLSYGILRKTPILATHERRQAMHNRVRTRVFSLALHPLQTASYNVLDGESLCLVDCERITGDDR